MQQQKQTTSHRWGPVPIKCHKVIKVCVVVGLVILIGFSLSNCLEVSVEEEDDGYGEVENISALPDIEEDEANRRYLRSRYPLDIPNEDSGIRINDFAYSNETGMISYSINNDSIETVYYSVPELETPSTINRLTFCRNEGNKTLAHFYHPCGFARQILRLVFR